MRELANINGRISSIQDAVIPAEDRGYLFGDGVYEVVRTYNSRIWALDRHWHRFRRSLEEIQLRIDNLEEIHSWILETYQESQIPNATLYYQLTRGVGPRSHVWTEDLKPTFFMSVRRFEEREYVGGVKVHSFPDQRWGRCDIKSLNLLPNVLVKQQARKLGGYEALLVNDQGHVTEGSSSAIMAIANDTIVVPPRSPSILPSITREFVREIAIEINLTFQERWLSLAEFGAVSEAFLAGTGDEIMGITHLNGKVIGTGKVGVHTQNILRRYRERINQQQD